MADTFQCTLITPQQQLLDEQVVYASIPAWDGLLGVAHQRAPLVVKLGDGPLRLDRPDGTSQWFFIAGGFAQMVHNQLSLLTEQAIPAEEINAQEAQAALREAQAGVTTNDAQRDKKAQAVKRARALIAVSRRHG